MNPLLQQFLIEARDFLEQIGQKLLLLEETPGNEEIIGEIFRAVHTLKGNSGLFDMPYLTSVVHAAEDLLDRVRDHSMEMDPELTDALLDAMDFVSRLLDDVEAGGTIRSDHAGQAGDIAENLRRRLPVRNGVEAEAVGEDASRVEPPADWTWLARIPEADRLAAFDVSAKAGTLMALRYRPEPDCFFKGEDPLLLVRTVPGISLFDITAPEPWPEPSALDVYRCNLQFDLLSSAARDEIEHHFRYVREQVALYELPAFALALPVGDNEAAEASMIGPVFLERAREQLAASDLPGLLGSTDAALDMINPALRAASALRWLRCLIKADVAPASVGCLVEALDRDGLPDWKAIADAAGNRVPRPAGLPVSSLAGPPDKHATLDREDAQFWHDLVITQISVLSRPVRRAEHAGRIRSVRNVLASLLHVAGRSESLPELEAATQRALEGHDPALLAGFIEGGILGAAPIKQLSEVPSLDPSIELPEEPPREQPALELAIGSEPSVARSAGSGDPARRNAEVPAGDRGVRVLKVPQEKVDRLMDLIGEMVVAKNALPYLAARAEDHFGSRDLSREIKSQYAIINRIAEEMQDGIMQVRMLPVGAVFQRFPRLVRDVARQLGKVVRLVVEGEETEADKNIVESLADPMIHILRNSLDHGLETPEVRRAQGKPEEGRLTVRASQEGDRVLIEIEDDGKGIDAAVVKRKAFEKGLIDEQRLESLTDAEAVQLVFAPGFSTAEQISNLSGRGVGMDVVKSSLEKVGGHVRLTSEKGKGTRILLSLPLSVSVSNVMMVQIAGQQYGVPMESVVETVRVASKDIHAFKDQRTAVLRGHIVPLYGANQLLRCGSIPKPNGDDEYAVLVVRIGGQTVGIIVDGFAQTIDVILKPLEGPLANIVGFSGSALLGNGSVLLVLNLKELL